MTNPTLERDEDLLTSEEMADPWTHLVEAKKRIQTADQIIRRQGERLRDYAEAQARALPDVASSIRVAAVEEANSQARILAIRPEAFDIRFQREMLMDVTHPSNIADIIEAGLKRYSEDLLRKVAKVTNIGWFQ